MTYYFESEEQCVYFNDKVYIFEERVIQKQNHANRMIKSSLRQEFINRLNFQGRGVGDKANLLFSSLRGNILNGNPIYTGL